MSEHVPAPEAWGIVANMRQPDRKGLRGMRLVELADLHYQARWAAKEHFDTECRRQGAKALKVILAELRRRELRT